MSTTPAVANSGWRPRVTGVLTWIGAWLADDPAPPVPRVARRWRLAVHGLALAAALAGAAAFWGTAASTSWARISVLRTVEPYGFAVHEQLIRNRAETGHFHQTIHRGYDDAWTWSGHRAVTLVTSSWLYPFHPSAHWLARILIIGVLLGAIPAALLGRRAMGSGWGLAVGALLYLGSPAVMALALQDYQDLVFALPCLTFALWAFGSRRLWWTPIAAFVGLMPREECVPLVVLAALIVVPPALAGRRWKRWLLNVGTTALVAGAYTAYISWRHPVSLMGEIGGGHDTPAVNASLTAVQAILGGELPGLEVDNGFYALMFAPLGALALRAPLTALPGVALILLHMTVPHGHGVDRTWGGHAHHMAPAMAFLVAAGAQGAGRLLRDTSTGRWRGRWAAARGWRPRLARLGPGIAATTAVITLLVGFWWYARWADWFNLVTAWRPQPPRIEHPAWTLARMLPDDAVPAVFLDASITVSNRERAYTYEESLLDKAPDLGLGAASHMIVDKRNSSALAWGLSMPRVEVLAEEGDYALLTWSPGGGDPTMPRGRDQGSWTPTDRTEERPEGMAPPWTPPGVGQPPGCPRPGR